MRPPIHSRPVVRLFALALLATVVALPPAVSAGEPQARAILAQVDFADVVEQASPAVVQVIGIRGAAPREPANAPLPPELRNSPFGELFRFFGERQQPETPRRGGQGSGFIVDADGYVVTNAHVVGDADAVRVVLADGREFDGEVIGRDRATDLALVRVETDEPLPTLALGDSSALRVGEPVMAMGNPFGLGGTVTAGIVSARGRNIGAGPYDDFIQTDAPINPGNSGGPLVNGAGEVVGVNTAIFSPSGGNVGIGFAIPANMVQDIVAQLRADGTVIRGWLGVGLQPMDAELAAALGATVTSGALVSTVEPDSPAEEAGLRPGDVVVGIDEREVQNPRDLATGVAAVMPGQAATLHLERDGERIAQTVVIGDHPSNRAEAEAPAPLPAALGLELAPRDEGGVGVASVEPGSAAAEKGLRAGDVIVRAGDRDVRTPADVSSAVEAAAEAGRSAIALQIERDGRRSFVAVPLGTA